MPRPHAGSFAFRPNRTPAPGTTHTGSRPHALLLLAALALWPSCRHAATTVSPPILTAGALLPSPRLIVGRIVAVDGARQFAFVELASDAPPAALGEGTELIARTLDLRETARIQASRHVRGRTLGARIVGGQPSPGDEVVWLAP